MDRREFLRRAVSLGISLLAVTLLADADSRHEVFALVSVSLLSGHQVLVRRNPKPATGYVQDPAIVLSAADSVSIDPTRLPVGHKVYVRRNPKPAAGWTKDPLITLTATDTLTIPALDGGGSTPPPPPPSGLRGFGANVQRSTAALTTVTSLAALRSAAGAGGKNIKVDAPLDTIWNLSGQDLNVASGTAIDFGPVFCMGGALKIAGVSDVFIENARFGAGDQYGNATDLDSLSINGNQKPVRRVYIRNSQFIWGPDVDGSFLGDVGDITCEGVVFAEGLYNSAHAESPHSLGPNVASENAATPAHRVSFIECLISTNQSRNIRWIGVVEAEAIGCTIYNYNEGPQGCPTSANILGCTWKKGPIALANTLLFRAQDGGHGAFVAQANSVYVGPKRQVIGFTASGVDSKVAASTPRFTSTEAEPDAATAHATVLASVGAVPADKQLTRILNNVRNGTGQYVNGFGKTGSYTGLI